MTLYRPQRTPVPGTDAHRLIRGVLRVEGVPPHTGRIDLLHQPDWSLSIVDTGDGEDDGWIPDGDVTIHILWQAHEGDAAITVDGVRYPIVPGDTMSVPGGATIRQAPGMLLCQVEATARTLDQILPPNHGVESFANYNRRTDYDTPAAFTLERWKITQPLTLPAPDSPYGIVGLIDPLALVWSGGTDLVGRGESRVILPESGRITLLPDGLGYALIVRDSSPD